MINLKLILNNPSILDDSLKKRNLPPKSNNLIILDKEVRKLLTQIQDIKFTCNKLSGSIGHLTKQGKEVSVLKKEVAKYKLLETNLLAELESKQKLLKEELLYTPNILDFSVPNGIDENDNVLIRTFLTPKEFNFSPLPHYVLGEKLGFIDFKRAVKLSGSRFTILNSDLAKLERALINFMLEVHTKENGFTEYTIPLIVNEEALVGTSQLPKFADDMFKTNYGNKWLISTGEISLTNLYREETLNIKDLPRRIVGVSQCFRKEAGSRGKDTKGMLRQHQFTKVELVSFVLPQEGLNELEYITKCAESILQKLEIPYRVMLLCGGDTGFASSKTYDIEVWLPSENKYREISSCSLCTDFQARRMNTKFIDNKLRNFVYTLNGSGLAVGRTLIAILENYQQKDGSIEIPKVLVPYMGGLTVIKN